MANSQYRAKFGYLNYDDMIAKIENGVFDAYDIVYCKDRKTQYVINPDLEPIEVSSRVKTFDDLITARTELNADSSTYKGQVVSILDGDVYRGYVVNQDVYGNFYATPLYENPNVIDYDTLGNRPIENLRGEAASPIEIASLDTGIYEIKGYYKTPNDENTCSTVVGVLAIVEDIDGVKTVKLITTNNVYDYEINGTDVTTAQTVTDQYLESQGYITETNVDTKLEALKASIKSEIKDYVDTTFEEMIDSKIDEKIETIPSEDIEELFDDDDDEVIVG